jgi:hypothetical protein
MTDDSTLYSMVVCMCVLLYDVASLEVAFDRNSGFSSMRQELCSMSYYFHPVAVPSRARQCYRA